MVPFSGVLGFLPSPSHTKSLQTTTLCSATVLGMAPFPGYRGTFNGFATPVKRYTDYASEDDRQSQHVAIQVSW